MGQRAGLPTHHRRGFSLVELLVVIAVIGILVSLLVVASQAVMENARQTKCRSNLAQLGLAANMHVGLHKHFPTGGWGFRWAGDPDRGYGKEQPGGWLYNLLPFVEEVKLHDLGRRASTSAKRAAGAVQAGTAVPLFMCPARRSVQPYPFIHTGTFYNIDRPEQIGKTDFAANAGDTGCNTPYLGHREGPMTLKEGDSAPTDRGDWGDPSKRTSEFHWPRLTYEATGLVFVRSMVRPEEVSDGLGNVYLAGEKYLRPSQYHTGDNKGDDQGWNVGFDKDVNRFTEPGKKLGPRQDSDLDDENFRFGSSHPFAMTFVLASGTVRGINYSIDEITHARLGNRADGHTVQLDAAQ